MLDSLFKNNTEREFKIFVIVPSKNDRRFQNMGKLILEYGAEFEIIEINNDRFSNVKITGHISVATYFRLFLTDLLPANIDNILFLDCDLLILGDIKDFYDLDNTKFDIAAVEELFSSEHKIKIGMSKETPYFNAGVMLINLKTWREKDYLTKFLKYLELHNEKVVYWDQDVLNSIIESRLILNKNLNLIENEHIIFCSNLNENVKILHFTGSCKPWNCKRNLLTPLYFKSVVQSKSKVFFKVFLKESFIRQVKFMKARQLKKVIKEFVIIFAFISKKEILLVKYFNYR
jgi:lipopolysaccharide biosynthesis glycosyltransferase